MHRPGQRHHRHGRQADQFDRQEQDDDVVGGCDEHQAGQRKEHQHEEFGRAAIGNAKRAGRRFRQGEASADEQHPKEQRRPANRPGGMVQEDRGAVRFAAGRELLHTRPVHKQQRGGDEGEHRNDGRGSLGVGPLRFTRQEHDDHAPAGQQGDLRQQGDGQVEGVTWHLGPRVGSSARPERTWGISGEPAARGRPPPRAAPSWR